MKKTKRLLVLALVVCMTAGLFSGMASAAGKNLKIAAIGDYLVVSSKTTESEKFYTLFNSYLNDIAKESGDSFSVAGAFGGNWATVNTLYDIAKTDAAFRGAVSESAITAVSVQPVGLYKVLFERLLKAVKVKFEEGDNLYKILADFAKGRDLEALVPQLLPVLYDQVFIGNMNKAAQDVIEITPKIVEEIKAINKDTTVIVISLIDIFSKIDNDVFREIFAQLFGDNPFPKIISMLQNLPGTIYVDIDTPLLPLIDPAKPKSYWIEENPSFLFNLDDVDLTQDLSAIGQKIVADTFIQVLPKNLVVDIINGIPVVAGLSAVTANFPTKVNGKAVPLVAYNYNGNNYVKVRDLAMIVNGTSKNFGIDYNADTKVVDIKKNTAYTPAGVELVELDPGIRKTFIWSNDAWSIDGTAKELKVLKIEGANYVQVRELLGEVLDMEIIYNASSREILINTANSYIAP